MDGNWEDKMMRDIERKPGPESSLGAAQEQEAVRTTIVGGRPPGSGQSVGAIPRGIEVLIKKAAVDPAFKQSLLAGRDKAAAEIGLRLEPAETLMLRAVPEDQLETIIGRTSVPQEHRRVFLGKAAAAMLAALGLTQTACRDQNAPGGARPDLPPATTTGIQPDMPEDLQPPPVEPVGGTPPEDAPPQTSSDAPEKANSEQTGGSSPSERIPAPTGIRPDRPD
jgi:hypothetical protein